MNSLLIASFEDETSARSAMKKFDDLALNGTIDLYERTLIRKTWDGRVELFREGASAGWQTLSGALAGSLVGMVGGPVSFVIGLLSGAVVGSAISDREQHTFSEGIQTIVEKDIRPGTVAIVAHIGERDPKVVDSLLKKFGSVPVRNEIQNEPGDENKTNYEMIRK